MELTYGNNTAGSNQSGPLLVADVFDAQAQNATGARSMHGVPFAPTAKVRLALIGVGGRGNSLLDNFAPIPNVEITALCDVVPDKVEKGAGQNFQPGKAAQAPRRLLKRGSRL